MVRCANLNVELHIAQLHRAPPAPGNVELIKIQALIIKELQAREREDQEPLLDVRGHEIRHGEML